VATKRRPQRERVNGLEPVLISALSAVVGDYSVADRLDGPTSKKDVRPRRHRTSHTTPLNLDTLDFHAAYAVFGPIWDFAESIDSQLATRRGPGRPREYAMCSIVMSDVMLQQKLSVRGTFRSIENPIAWNHLRHRVEQAWPEHPERRLPEKPLSRYQYNRGRKILLNEVFCYIDQLREHVRTTQLEIAKRIGCFANTDSLTHPDSHNIIYGDATWMASLYASTSDTPHIDAETGEILGRLYDPDAERYRDGTQAPGNYWVSLSVRTKHEHERVIVDAQFKPRGVGDGGVFTNMVLPIFEVHPQIRGVGYDMALYATDQDRILDTGRHVLVKTPLTKKGRRAEVPLGALIFKDGARSISMPVTAVDGTPGVQLVVDGQRHFQPLERVQTKLRNKTVYGRWRIPKHPSVSAHLQGLTTMIRHSSTADERANNKPRTRALRTIPPTDADWAGLYGGREDLESMHNNMKEKMFGRRARAVGLQKRELQLRGYQTHQGITALLAWHFRTGGDVSSYFGEWKPPDRNPKPRR